MAKIMLKRFCEHMGKQNLHPGRDAAELADAFMALSERDTLTEPKEKMNQYQMVVELLEKTMQNWNPAWCMNLMFSYINAREQVEGEKPELTAARFHIQK